MTPNPVTIRADIAEGLAQEGMKATGRDREKYHQGLAVTYTSRITGVGSQIWLGEDMGYQPEQVELNLLDPITLQACVAWVASRLLGEEGRVFGPDEVFCIFDRRDGQWPTLTIGLVGARRSATIDDLGVVAITGQPWRGSDDALVGIFDHVSPSLAGTRLGRALALKAAVEAIAARDLRR